MLFTDIWIEVLPQLIGTPLVVVWSSISDHRWWRRGCFIARRLSRVIYLVFSEPPDLLTSSEAIKYEISVVIFAVGTWTNETLDQPYNEN
jgi:hypothetical protein